MAYTIGPARRQQKVFLAITATALCLAACTPTQAVRGNMLQDYQLAAVLVGSDTRSDVQQKLGSPTTVAPFDDKVWYYMGQDTEKHGPLDPKITKEEVIRVTFDADDKVAEIKNVTEHREDVPLSRDKTPTNGNEITIPQQLLGNLGKFNKAASETPGTIGSDSGTGNGR